MEQKTISVVRLEHYNGQGMFRWPNRYTPELRERARHWDRVVQGGMGPHINSPDIDHNALYGEDDTIFGFNSVHTLKEVMRNARINFDDVLMCGLVLKVYKVLADAVCVIDDVQCVFNRQAAYCNRVVMRDKHKLIEGFTDAN